MKTKAFEVTGRLVLTCLLGFFAVVFAVNGVMVYAAKSTFGGVETSSSYKAGLAFNRDVATAKAQSARGWKIEGRLQRAGDGEAVLDVTANDARGVPLAGLRAQARLVHPADERQDHPIALAVSGAGRFHGAVPVHAGQWELIVDLYRDDERMFRSRSRVVLK